MAGAFGAGISCVLMTWLPMGWSQFLVLHLLAGPAMLWIGIQLDGLVVFKSIFSIVFCIHTIWRSIGDVEALCKKREPLFWNSSSLLLWDSNHLEFSVKVAGISAEYLLCHVIYRKEILYCAGTLGYGECSGSRSKKPVCVLEKRAALRLLDQTEASDEIPYHTIGGRGMMPVYELKKMYIEQECKFWIEHPLVGICEEQLSERGISDDHQPRNNRRKRKWL